MRQPEPLRFSASKTARTRSFRLSLTSWDPSLAWDEGNAGKLDVSLRIWYPWSRVARHRNKKWRKTQTYVEDFDILQTFWYTYIKQYNRRLVKKSLEKKLLTPLKSPQVPLVSMAMYIRKKNSHDDGHPPFKKMYFPIKHGNFPMSCSFSGRVTFASRSLSWNLCSWPPEVLRLDH